MSKEKDSIGRIHTPKSTESEVESRVLEVLEAILEGGNTHEIVVHFSSKWQITERQVYTYIQKANDKFKEYAKTEAKAEIGKGLSRLNKLFNKSLQIMDFKTCLAVQKEINSMLGLNEPEKIDHTTKGESLNEKPDLSNLSNEEKRKFGELLKKSKGLNIEND